MKYNPFLKLKKDMGCVTLTKSRKLPCNSSMAGIAAVGIASFDSSNKIVKTSTGVIELATKYGTATIARFDVKNTTTNYVENGVSGGDNRSIGVTGKVPLVLNVPTGGLLDTEKIISELVKGEIVLFIEYKSGEIVCAGSQLGAEVITFDFQTGGAIGDMKGCTLTIETKEPDLSAGYILVGAGLTDYALALMEY